MQKDEYETMLDLGVRFCAEIMLVARELAIINNDSSFAQCPADKISITRPDANTVRLRYVARPGQSPWGDDSHLNIPVHYLWAENWQEEARQDRADQLKQATEQCLAYEREEAARRDARDKAEYQRLRQKYEKPESVEMSSE